MKELPVLTESRDTIQASLQNNFTGLQAINDRIIKKLQEKQRRISMLCIALGITNAITLFILLLCTIK